MQTNVTYPNLSEKMLSRFEQISTKENVSEIKPLSTSIQIDCKCGCRMVEHFGFGKPTPPMHHEKYFVQLCNKHELSEEEIKCNVTEELGD